MSLEIIITLTAVIILLLLFTWLVNVLKSTVKTGLIIVAILVLLQIIFDVDSNLIIQEVSSMAQRLQQFFLDKIAY